MPRLLAIDYGEKRIGLAVSDETKTIAQMLSPIIFENERQLLADLKNLVGKEDIEKILIGLPLTVDGNDSRQTKKTREFAEKLRSDLPNVRIEFADERFTSKAALRALASQKVFGKKSRGQVDSLAAQFFLQTYLRK